MERLCLGENTEKSINIQAGELVVGVRGSLVVIVAGCQTVSLQPGVLARVTLLWQHQQRPVSATCAAIPLRPLCEFGANPFNVPKIFHTQTKESRTAPKTEPYAVGCVR